MAAAKNRYIMNTIQAWIKSFTYVIYTGRITSLFSFKYAQTAQDN